MYCNLCITTENIKNTVKINRYIKWDFKNQRQEKWNKSDNSGDT